MTCVLLSFGSTWRQKIGYNFFAIQIMTFSQIKGIFTFFTSGNMLSNVSRIKNYRHSKGCMDDSTKFKSQKYPITMNDTSNEDNGNLLLSTSSESCKITIHLDGSEERAQKYIGDWKCHLAKTDTDEVSSSYKDETDYYTSFSCEEILPFDSGEVIEKTRILSTNESVCEIKDTDFQNDSSIAKPEPNLSLWLSSPIEDQLISKLSRALYENDLDLIPISLQFYSQPPPQKNSIFWTFNDVIIKPNQTIEVENDLILRTSD
ncbi:unnamed protein product [Lepeophtheirus salmonis]|uniref:(salmon louse) hypothetical protein n=1 Tax=Lepeophtheirus salmonis TaxID=72036 RepID=A0A7R8HBD0_LEPSM|nr:unnamed protein product [Lepeophtheirus salmonis]CAF2984828.1 unnamed protein product [Lepeophtheirus salmonis]